LRRRRLQRQRPDDRRRRVEISASPMFDAFIIALSSIVAAPVLRSADLKIAVTSPTSCEVTMSLAVDGGADIDHRIETFEGSRIQLAAVRGAQQVDRVRVIGRTQSLVLRPDAEKYELSYRAVQPA